VTKAESYGHIENGELKIVNRTRFLAELREFKNCEVQIIVKKRGKRSTQANRFYWGVVIEEIRHEFIRRGNRFSPEEIHEALKLKFNPHKEIDENTGEVLLEIGQTTTEMNKEEFGAYLDRVIEWCNTSLEIIIPEPGQQSEMFAA
jgi:hypothetical protein